MTSRIFDWFSTFAVGVLCMLIASNAAASRPILAVAIFVAHASARSIARTRAETARAQAIGEALRALQEEADAAADPSVSLVIISAALAMSRKVRP